MMNAENPDPTEQTYERHPTRGGNIEPLKPTEFQIDKLRSSWRLWAETEISQWSSCIFITLNFKPRVLGDGGRAIRLTEEIARQAVKWFGNRIDRKVHGNKVQRFNTRVPRIPFLEHGNDRGWHCHIVMEKPIGMIDVKFHGIIQDAWTDNEWCAGLPDIRPADVDLAGYLTKILRLR
jgi:hypothetical protein